MFGRLLCLMAFVSAFVLGQEDTARRIDSIFERWNKATTPGASIAVVRDGKVVFQKGYGAANLEYDIPIGSETVFHVASVSKQFTAMALVLLEQDHKLSLEDEIHKYLPELPDYGKPITIRNLLQHTSGIRDQWQTLGVAGWRLDDVITQKQILRMLFRQKELNFAPGTRHLYSNGGYTLAAEIVTRVSGKPMADFCNERIFRQLAMTHTHFHDDHRRIVRERAYSYESAVGGFRASPLNYANIGATGLFTTSVDLVKWLDNFREPKVGGENAIARLQEQAVLSGGQKRDYALGVVVSTHRGLRTISHSGGDAGYRSYVIWFPEHRLGIAVLSNLAEFNPGDLANQVAAVYLEKQMSAPQVKPSGPARPFITLTPEAIQPFEGYYRLPEGLVQITQNNGKLMGAPLGATPLELKPISANRFYVEQMQAEVEFIPHNGAGMHIKLTQPAGIGEGDRVPFIPFDPKESDRYTGIYWSDELETQYTILAKNGKLVADHPHHGEIALTPLDKDQFRAAAWFMPEIRFNRDADGKIIGMTAGGNRVSGIKFAKR